MRFMLRETRNGGMSVLDYSRIGDIRVYSAGVLREGVEQVLEGRGANLLRIASSARRLLFSVSTRYLALRFRSEMSIHSCRPVLG